MELTIRTIDMERQAWVRQVVTRARDRQQAILAELQEVEALLRSSFWQSVDCERKERLLEELVDVASKARYPLPEETAKFSAILAA